VHIASDFSSEINNADMKIQDKHDIIAATLDSQVENSTTWYMYPVGCHVPVCKESVSETEEVIRSYGTKHPS